MPQNKIEFSNSQQLSLIDRDSIKNLCDELNNYCIFMIKKAEIFNMRPKQCEKSSENAVNAWIITQKWVSKLN